MEGEKKETIRRIINVRNLNFIYPNKLQALKNVSFSIFSKEGKIIGLLGPNGAGKTTLINILIGCFPKIDGEAFVLDLDVKKDYQKIRKIISIAPQQIIIDALITLYDNLFIHGLILGVPNNLLKERIEYFLKKIELWEKKNSLAINLSGGQMRRLQLARALLKKEAAIFFIDEPTLGLDPIGKEIIWEELRKLKRDGKIIFLASNDMSEVEKLCDEIIFINKGEIFFQGEVEKAKNSFAPHKVIEIEVERGINEENLNELKNNFSVYKIFSIGEPFIFKIWLKQNEDAVSQIINWINEKKLGIKKFKIKEGTLEDVFYALIEDKK